LDNVRGVVLGLGRELSFLVNAEPGLGLGFFFLFRFDGLGPDDWHFPLGGRCNLFLLEISNEPREIMLRVALPSLPLFGSMARRGLSSSFSGESMAVVAHSFCGSAL